MKKTELDPFVPLNLRAFVECDPEERSVVLALNFWHWWRGDKEGLGLEGIAALSRLPYTTAKRVINGDKKRGLPGMKGKGWVDTARGFKEKNLYRLTIAKMDFREAYRIVQNWMPKEIFEDPQLELLGLSFSPQGSNREPQGGQHIKRVVSDLESKTRFQTSPPPRAHAPRDPRAYEDQAKPRNDHQPRAGKILSVTEMLEADPRYKDSPFLKEMKKARELPQ